MKPLLKDVYYSLTASVEKLTDTLIATELETECLDFIAMVSGLKPVFLLGRGVDHPEWVEGVISLSEDLELNVSKGPFWDATPYGSLPSWYKKHCQKELSHLQAFYIASGKETVSAVSRINKASGRLGMSEEARLLGYPDCCVAAHYHRALRYHRATISILKRLAKGNEGQMHSLLTGGANFAPATKEEIADFEEAFSIYPATHGSWNMCSRCVSNPDSLSKKLSTAYRNLLGKL